MHYKAESKTEKGNLIHSLWKNNGRNTVTWEFAKVLFENLQGVFWKSLH